MKKKHVSGVIALAVAAFSGMAQAGFTVEEAGGRNQTSAGESRAEQLLPGLSQIGAPSGPQPVVRGMAKDVSLITALKQIVPPGWRAKRAGGLDVNQMVSWKGTGKPWVDVLQDIAAANRFNALVDWVKQEVTVAPVSLQSARDGLRPAGVVSPAVAPMGPKVWTLNTSMTLRENIEAWAKESGWSVSWAAVDYPVTSKVSLIGAIDDPVAGPLTQLAKAYETAEQPLTFTFYTNKVVRVENATYKQINVNDQQPNHRAMQ